MNDFYDKVKSERLQRNKRHEELREKAKQIAHSLADEELSVHDFEYVLEHIELEMKSAAKLTFAPVTEKEIYIPFQECPPRD